MSCCLRLDRHMAPATGLRVRGDLPCAEDRGDLGGASRSMGIDLDRDPEDVERWALGATLLGNRISTAVAMRTYCVFARAGVRTIGDAGGRDREELISLLDEGGYVLYGEPVATRLLDLAEVVADRYDERLATLGEVKVDPRELEHASRVCLAGVR